ncbi:MAG: TrmH family RNA methyltransferase [Candidatus Doudnabacteria bacterium]|nr:TrmH family RNA methyltransferase [Candidatus Doudnabacteria bacterium]
MFFLLAHNIRSLHNVGSFFRTSDVFAVDKLFLTGYTGHPPDEKLSKVALGTDVTVPWEYVKMPGVVIRNLRRKYPALQVVGLENNLPKGKKALTLPQFKPKGPVLLVLGEEVSGIPASLLKQCDSFVEIPQFGQKESLNVSVAFGIAAYVIATVNKE